MKSTREKRRVYVGFMDLEKVYDIVNREALCEILRMYDVGGKLLSGIKSMYVDSSACVRVKGIDGGVKQEYVISPWLFIVYIEGLMKGVKMGMESGDYLASCMQMI